MLQRLTQAFLSIPGPWAVAAVFFLAAGETALFIGFLIPGELAVILGGVLASRAHVPLAGVLVASVAGPIVGDSIGYFLGRRYGENVSHGKLKKRWAKAQSWIRRKGAPAVLLGCFAAAKYETVARWMGRLGLIVLAAAAVAVVGFLLWKRFRGGSGD